ncbi:TPA: GmrSD restriction endonuclease domain-containing protein, partial [Listeria innocua]
MNLITTEQKKKAEQQILNLQERVDYDIRDYPIEFIVSKYDSEDYFIPDYQREFIWSSSDQARFIESLLLDLPIPLLFL